MNEQKTNFDTETARDDSDVILDVRNLDVYLNTYSGRIHAVRDVSFTLKKGETLVVVGESGCGKSMTARAIMQLLPEKISEVGERSQILFNGTDILKMPEKKKETELKGKIYLHDLPGSHHIFKSHHDRGRADRREPSAPQ